MGGGRPLLRSLPGVGCVPRRLGGGGLPCPRWVAGGTLKFGGGLADLRGMVRRGAGGGGRPGPRTGTIGLLNCGGGCTNPPGGPSLGRTDGVPYWGRGRPGRGPPARPLGAPPSFPLGLPLGLPLGPPNSGSGPRAGIVGGGSRFASRLLCARSIRARCASSSSCHSASATVRSTRRCICARIHVGGVPEGVAGPFIVARPARPISELACRFSMRARMVSRPCLDRHIRCNFLADSCSRQISSATLISSASPRML